MRAILTGLLLFVSLPLLAVEPPTTNNNSTCDIGVYPAATLLLPYFEVDTAAAQGFGATTLFTITNTSCYPQIAHVTIWTDWAFPVLGFDLFLTGYDVQGINLRDVIVRGFVAPTADGVNGPSITTVPGSPRPAGSIAGATPFDNTSNPNFIAFGELGVNKTCVNLPGLIGFDLTQAVKSALTAGVGSSSCGPAQIGFNHGSRAEGYITVDVVSHCTSKFPTDADGSYFAGPTAPILFDNVLLGDYQQIGPTPAGFGAASTFDAEGSPMVHIRAVPEGGLSGAGGGVPVETNLPFTFYDRYTPAGVRGADRRQPLPSVWTARYIEGGAGNFATDLKIWREGLAAGQPICAGASGMKLNASIGITDVIRFDEHENSYGFDSSCNFYPGCDGLPSFPATSRTASSSWNYFPHLAGTDAGGWFYLNLSSGAHVSTYPPQPCHAVLSAQRAGFGTCDNAAIGRGGSRTTSQNWVITSMFGAVAVNRLSVDFDAAALGNGCTPERPRGAPIAPSTQRAGLVCPNNTPATNCSPATRPSTPNP